MKYDDIMAMLTEIGLPFAYDHFAEGESPDPPFLVFTLPVTDNLFADDITYQQIIELDIELYTDFKSPPHERMVEYVLNSHEIPWNKEEVWIEDEELYEVRYEVSMLYDSDEGNE